ncbi:hypothetical protein CMI37_23725 [Candidatus Pacearchaeota archaeon]|nr:hypothetical protein [Candidatus Pacearchaeota archaeon]|tara:strand:- start:1645 stop:2949 length:1305 start_codon:yes stop_codon:yes gene_type:complete
MEVSPLELLRSQTHNDKFCRLDLVVRYIFLEGFYGKRDFSEAKKLYEKMQFHRCSTLRHPNGNLFTKDFEKLAKSFESKGYLEEHPLLVNKNKYLLDCSHRAACSLFFGVEKIPYEVREDWRAVLYNKKVNEKTYFNYGLKWFKENGFTEDEINTIEAKRRDLFLKASFCFPVVLWGTVHKFYERIKEDISKDFEILETHELEFEEESYKDFGRLLYEVDDISKDRIEKKFSRMKGCRKMSILFIHKWNPSFRAKTNFPDKLICIEVEELKKKVREKYKSLISDYYYDNIVHVGDNFEHTFHIKHLVKLNKLNTALLSLEIPKEDTCIVGSSIMTALGIKKDNDIDFTCLKKHRRSISSFLTNKKGYDDVDLVSENWCFFNKEVPDDALIKNPEHHFTKLGFKFANLDILLQRKKETRRPKDVADITTIKERMK